MRLIGTVATEEQAKKLEDYLLTVDISTKVLSSSSVWELWARDEDDRDRAKEVLEEFQSNPDDPRYAGAVDKARDLRRKAEREAKERQKSFVDLRQRWQPVRGQRPFTFFLMAVSILIALMTNLNQGEITPVRNTLSFETLRYTSSDLHAVLGELEPEHRMRLRGAVAGVTMGESQLWELRQMDEELHRHLCLRDIRRGQVWRLFTPIFLHFGLIHILFNMFWLHDLGSMIESRKGTLWLLLLVATSAALSNTAQDMVAGPSFGGMSGVVYALFGYVWMKTRFDPGSGLYLQPNTILMMMIWFFLCMTGLIGPIANAAHAGGLAVGVAFGIAPYVWRKLLRHYGIRP